MNEAFVAVLLAAVLGMLIGRTVAMPSRELELRSLARVEAKLDAFLKHEGITFDPYANVAPPVLDALRRGKKIEAIKEYREVSGVGLKEAKEYVEEVQRRASSRA